MKISEDYLPSSILFFNSAKASISPSVDFSSLEELAAGLASFAAFFSSSLKIPVWDTTTLLNSLLNSITLKSAVSPFLILEPSSFSNNLEGAKASTSASSNWTWAPLSKTSVAVPECTVPSAYLVSNLSQGFSVNCLWPKESLLASVSNSKTTTSNLSPTAQNSDGCLIFLVQERSEM